LTSLIRLSENNRWHLIKELALLSRHCNWGVERKRRRGRVSHRFKYFSSVSALFDPCSGVPPTFWAALSDRARDRGGASARWKAYGLLSALAIGECNITTPFQLDVSRCTYYVLLFVRCCVFRHAGLPSPNPTQQRSNNVPYFGGHGPRCPCKGGSWLGGVRSQLRFWHRST
jgi:hypothetical protein